MISKPINDIDFAGVLRRLLDIARRYHFGYTAAINATA